MTIRIAENSGSFAENKDVARTLRLEKIIPTLENGEDVILDFEGVESATQSFVHALVSDLFRRYGNDILERIKFKSCSGTVQGIIAIVVDYMQESQ